MRTYLCLALVLCPHVAASAAAQTSKPVPCRQGYYSFVPKTRDQAIGFSVAVQSTAIKVQFADFGRIFAERQPVSRPNVIQFSDNGGLYELTCSEDGSAKIVFPADDYSPVRRFNLKRTTGDIFKEYRRRGWKIED